MDSPDAPEPLRAVGPESPSPGVICFGDNAGARPELRSLSRRLAGHGLFVALADPWAASGERFQPPLGPADRKRIQPLREAFPLPRMAAYARDVAAALVAHPLSRGERVGLVGLCIGSGFVLAALEGLGAEGVFGASIVDGCELGDRLGAIPTTLPPLPLQLLQPTALAAFADHLVLHVEGAGGGPVARTDLPGLAHGFGFTDWPGGVHDAEAAERQLAAAAAFLRDCALPECRGEVGGEDGAEEAGPGGPG
ncbi:MAG: dienelactone hydrolase family protein [Myxococcota bacterium]|nr:dienelactone hydrolase family protein [Myxococcota bacterium]